jgi:hypothetical protein
MTPIWVASYVAGKPSVYYVSTDKKVQNAGKLIASFNPKKLSEGPGGWFSSDTMDNPIEVYTILGIDTTKAVAVKFVKNGPYIKCVVSIKHY